MKLFYSLKLIIRYRKIQLNISDEDILRDSWVILIKASQRWFPMSDKQLREAKIETCLINEVVSVKSNTVGDILSQAIGTEWVPLICREDTKLVTKLIMRQITTQYPWAEANPWDPHRDNWGM